MQARRKFFCELIAVVVSALLCSHLTVARADEPDPTGTSDFCRALAMFDVVEQEWGKALITGAKSRVANEAKRQANDARALFTKFTNRPFDKFDDEWKRACGYTEVLNFQEILIRSNNPFKDQIVLSELDEAKSLYRRWMVKVEREKLRDNGRKPIQIEKLEDGFYIQAIASPKRSNVESFWRSRPSLEEFKILELRRSPGSSTPNYALFLGPFGSVEEAQRFMSTPGLPRDLWLREASKIRPLLPEPSKLTDAQTLRRQAELEERRREESERILLEQLQLARLRADRSAVAEAKGADIRKDTQTEEGAESNAGSSDRTPVLARYAGSLRARIRSRISFDPSRAPNNPEVIFVVEQQPTGRVVRVTKKKSSGNAGWDAAVERAIWGSSPLPKTSDHRVESPITVAFRPLDRATNSE